MAEENESGEKTEHPTSRRLSETRRDGMVGRSIDLSQLLGITSAYVALHFIAPSMWEDLLVVIKASLSSSLSYEPMSVGEMQFHFIGLLRLFLPEILLLMVIAALFGAGSTAVQTNFLWSSKLLRPKFSQLNPIQGLKRIFGLQNAVNVLKSIAKLAIICPIAYFSFFDLAPQFFNLIFTPITHYLPFTAVAADYIFWRIAFLLLFLSIADFAWQKYSTLKKIKMTKSEVKDERKAVEGDEKTKMQIRARAMQRVRERMLHNVKTADVVVTNPTHLAIALRYEMKVGGAPIVVAKGREHLAERIKEIARTHGIPVIERKPLARALFKSVEVGQQIPYELFAAVAELLAYVFKLRGKNPFNSKKRNEPRAGN